MSSNDVVQLTMKYYATQAADEVKDKRANSNILEKLIAYGADVNIKNKNGITALMYGAQTDNDNTVQMLINAKADVNAEDKDGCTALIYAVGSAKCVSKLLSAGADVNKFSKNGYDALKRAIDYNNADTICTLIDNRASVNVCYPKEHNQTPLILAASKAIDFNSLQKIAEAGSNVNARDDNGCDALFYAVKNLDKSLVKYLLKKGANPNNRYKCLLFSKTLLLDIASSHHWEDGRYGIASLLIEYGADINAQDSNGYTALMLSVDHSWSLSNELGLARLLVRKGARIRGIKNDAGETVRDILNRRNIPFGDLYSNKTSYTTATGFMRWFK